MALRDFINSISDTIKKKKNDNTGFFQQGKFTMQPIQSAVSNIQQRSQYIPPKNTNYFNPNSNSGNNFWSTPVAKGISNAQQFAQNQYKVGKNDFNKFLVQPIRHNINTLGNQLQKIPEVKLAYSPQEQFQQKIGMPKILPNKTDIANFIINTPKGIADEVGKTLVNIANPKEFIKKENYKSILDNPLTLAGFATLDVLPGGKPAKDIVKGGVKQVSKVAEKNIVKNVPEIIDVIKNPLYKEVSKAKSAYLSKIKSIQGKYKTDLEIPVAIKKELQNLSNAYDSKFNEWQQWAKTVNQPQVKPKIGTKSNDVINNKPVFNIEKPFETSQQPSYIRRTGGNAPNFVAGEKGIFKVKNVSKDKFSELTPETKVQNISGEIKPIESGKIKSTLSLPSGNKKEILVSTKKEGLEVLKKNPNANVVFKIKNNESPIKMPSSEVPTPEQLQAEIPSRYNDFIKNIAGYSTETPTTTGTIGKSLWTTKAIGIQDKLNTKLEEGLSSDNPLIRGVVSTLHGFFKELGTSPERARAGANLRGGLAVTNQRAYDVDTSIRELLKGENKDSLERINAVLDPQIAKQKISYEQLTPNEKKVHDIVRNGLDLVHDMAYSNGSISKETYLANKGIYTPRMYDIYEMPEEINKFVTQATKKLDLSLGKERGNVTDWKVENALNDPVYALTKRLSQLESNKVIKQYTDFLSSNPRYVSDIELPGYTKLSDSPAYGSLSGKYVLNSAAEDLKGYFFSNGVLNSVYDALKKMDKIPLRQLQKKALTVLNPATNLANITSDNIFAFLSGSDPVAANKGIFELSKNPSLKKQYSDWLIKNGILGTDITRSDLVGNIRTLEHSAIGTAEKQGTLTKIGNKAQEFYGGVDDNYKLGTFKSLIDKGYSLDEATRLIGDGFQNYSTVGKFYDVWSKVPVFGNAFLKFQGDLTRIIKNGFVNKPLQTLAFIGMLKVIPEITSRLSGESPADKKVREERWGATVLPGLNIPLMWQTPFGEINIARYISPYYSARGESDAINIASNILPGGVGIDLLTNTIKGSPQDPSTILAQGMDDPSLAPFAQILMNKDFRGKPIADPNETKYKQSTLTDAEKKINQAKFLLNTYNPPFSQSLVNVVRSAKGETDQYGKERTLPQSLARVAGVKVEQFGPEQVKAELEKQNEITTNTNEKIQQNIKSIGKELYEGKITQKQHDERVAAQQNKLKEITNNPYSSTNLVKGYTKENGDYSTLDVSKIISMPTTTNYEKALKTKEVFDTINTIMSNNFKDQDKTELLNALGIDEPVAKYYQVANQNEDIRTAMVMDKLQSAQNVDDVTKTLVDGLYEINGKSIVTTTLLNNLVKQGIITKDLKNYVISTYDKLTGKKSGTGGTGGSSGNDYYTSKFSQIKKVNVPKVRFVNKKFNTQKLPTLNLNYGK